MDIVIVNERVFGRLDQKTQDAVLAAAKAAEERGWKLQADETGKLVDTLRSKGMEVRQPSPGLMAEMKKIGEQLVAEWSKAAGEDGPKVLDEFRKTN